MQYALVRELASAFDRAGHGDKERLNHQQKQSMIQDEIHDIFGGGKQRYLLRLSE